jgi:hypothetical protein
MVAPVGIEPTIKQDMSLLALPRAVERTNGGESRIRTYGLRLMGPAS